ncbi:Exportin-2-like isoform X2 [Oopsacas minuta]|uniref:Exportin-2-like isoform X2 n=1 Tax=Oopsacas minuta TaxID=111878 RepID=A0AAV7KGJ3_9METZ|nr:Exportin-2-like isoform X2 [Oopsacas minuta]
MTGLAPVGTKNVAAGRVEQVILPNVQLRDTDEEQFEDNADEYIRRDLEGSDVDTRRHAACHLIKSLCKHFEEKVIEIFNKFIQQMLSEYQQNPSTRWRDKDAALFLILSLASRGKTERYGITKISGLVNITDIYWTQVASELKHTSPCYPMLEATAITYVLHFRSLLSSDVLADAISSVTGLLLSSSRVVNTYAAAFCEKILFMTNSSPQSLQLDSIKPHIQSLLANLIHMLGVQGNEDNEYAMKCVMRLIVKSGTDQAACVEKVIPVLVDKLWKASKNPTKPHFNHFLFEAIGASIRGVCTQHPSAVTSFEQCLFPVFEDIMVRDVLEFLPYNFQLLALMLELRDQPIAESYTAIFPLILSPMLWERIGTVPALSRLMQAFIQKCPEAIQAEGKVHAILGVFQKLLASKSNDHEGFNILTSLLQYQGAEIVRPFLTDILILCFKRLQESRTIFYVRGLTKSFCSLVISFGPVDIMNTIDSIQGNLFGMLIEKVFIPEIPGVTAKDEEKRICVVGVMQILTQTPAMLQEPQYQKLVIYIYASRNAFFC